MKCGGMETGCSKVLGNQGKFQSRSKMGQDTDRLRGQPQPLDGSPTWQSIMVSSSFSSIFFSPVSAHRRASRTGPSGRPPSFFSGASQSKDKTTAGRRGVRWRTCPWRRTQTAQVGESCSLLEERGFPTLNQQQTQILNHPYLSQYFHTS